MGTSFIKYFSIISILFASFACHAQAQIAFAIGGASYTNSGVQLNVTITVDAITPTVITGIAANQAFRDDVAGAAFFGYYLTTGVTTLTQVVGTKVNIQIRKGVRWNRQPLLLFTWKRCDNAQRSNRFNHRTRSIHDVCFGCEK